MTADDMTLRVTVCELPDDPGPADAWHRLAAHVRATRPDLLVLPEMPFYHWLARQPTFDPGAWRMAVDAHEHQIGRLAALGVPAVVSSRPVDRATRRSNEAFLWSARGGYTPLHAKNRLPAEPGFWEAAWFDPGPDGPPITASYDAAVVSALVCSELWSFERARAAAEAGANLIATPRATSTSWTERWFVAGRAAAISSGAFSLSSNRSAAPDFGGCGWVIDPDGVVVASTRAEEPFVTVDLDLRQAERARFTYPRNLVGPDRGIDE